MVKKVLSHAKEDEETLKKWWWDKRNSPNQFLNARAPKKFYESYKQTYDSLCQNYTQTDGSPC